MAELQQKRPAHSSGGYTASSAERDEALQRAHDKEAALLRRIDVLENGPGSACELREEIEALRVQLGQQKQKEKHRHVVAEMLQSTITDAGTTVPGGKRAAMAARAAKLFAPHAADPTGGASDVVPELRIRAASAQRQVAELQEQLAEKDKVHESTLEKLNTELKRSKAEALAATEALRSVHVDAGIHEAQEMTQLRMELAATSEEVRFLKSREDELRNEQNKVMNAQELNRKFNASVSRSEHEGLRTQVASLNEECQRVQETNQSLQAQLRAMRQRAVEMDGVESEITAFQRANDALEGELRDTRRACAVLREEARQAKQTMREMEHQLILNVCGSRRASLPPQPAAAADEAPNLAASRSLGRSVGGGIAVSGGAMPLLWGEDEPAPSVGSPCAGRVSASGAAAAAGAAGAAGATHLGGPAAPGFPQRAIVMSNEEAPEPMRAMPVAPPPPLRARRPPASWFEPLAVTSNEAELAAKAARRDEAHLWGQRLKQELRKSKVADGQELAVLRAGAAAATLSRRVEKLSALRHWWLSGLVRAWCRWANLLELDGVYNLAIGEASTILERGAAGVVETMRRTQQGAVQLVLERPEMLGRLGELRQRVQATMHEGAELTAALGRLGGGAAIAVGQKTPPILLGGRLGDAADARAHRSESQVETLTAATHAAAVPPMQRRGGCGDAAAGTATAGASTVSSPSGGSPGREARGGGDALPPRERLAMRILCWRWRKLKRDHALLEQLLTRRSAELLLCTEQYEALANTVLGDQGNESLPDLRARSVKMEARADAAMSSLNAQQAEHAEEVALLSEKLRQLLDERQQLEALCALQKSDLQVLTQEVVRLQSRPEY